MGVPPPPPGEERNKIIVKIPYCSRNERLSKSFISKLNKFAGFNHIFIILWQNIFILKDKNTHRSHVVYKGECSCGDSYIGKTMRNVEVRIQEHFNACNDSEPARHLRDRLAYTLHAAIHGKRRIFEGPMIQQWKPALNKQLHCYIVSSN